MSHTSIFQSLKIEMFYEVTLQVTLQVPWSSSLSAFCRSLCQICCCEEAEYAAARARIFGYKGGGHEPNSNTEMQRICFTSLTSSVIA